jgi:hypothetical protein
MVVFPLFSKQSEGPEYLTMSDALEKGSLVIGEVSAGGSVPELKAVNKGREAVLMLDGEELVGAKQNRVLNTTIMVGPGSSVVIPVSCVEQSRWRGADLRMERSENVMAASLRSKKVASVNRNLEASDSYMADQDMIWSGVRKCADELGVNSPTGAMRDIYEARKKDLDDYLQAFSPVLRQKGLLVFIKGKPAGLDFVSRETAFARLFNKLLRSYVLETLLAGRRGPRGAIVVEDKNIGGAGAGASADRAAAFLEEASRCEEKRFASIGLGHSCRYRGKRLVGAGLEVDGSMPHLAFFSLNGADERTHGPSGGDNFPRLRTRQWFAIYD